MEKIEYNYRLIFQHWKQWQINLRAAYSEPLFRGVHPMGNDVEIFIITVSGEEAEIFST